MSSTAPSVTDIISAVSNLGLLGVAIAAFIVATGQLRAVTRERSVRLMQEAASNEMEGILGFFDFAADRRVSRQAFSKLYSRLVRTRPRAIRERNINDVDAAASTTAELIVTEIDAVRPQGDDRRREIELRRRLIMVTNFFERIWALAKNRAIDKSLFLGSQAYNIVATYYVTELVLNDLVKHEGFDFDDFRELALEARTFLNWLESDDPLRVAIFAPLPLAGSSLREND